MKTVPYSDILNATLQLAGIDRASLSKKTFNTFRDFFSKRIAEIWNKERWPEFVQYVTRYPGMQLYRIDYTPSGGYINLYFCKDQSSEYYEETNFDLYPYFDGGTITIQLPKGVLLTAPTSTAISTTANILYVGDFDDSGVATVIVQCVASSLNGTSTITETTRITEPRYQLYPFNNYIGSCVLTKNGEDGAEVTPIYRTKLPVNADTVQGVYNRDPRTTTKTQQVAWIQEDSGISSGYVEASEQKYIITRTADQICIEYSIENPVVWGDVYSNTTTYLTGAQFFYYRYHNPEDNHLNPTNDRKMKGDFYSPVTQLNAGTSPLTNPGDYKIIPIPDLFKDFLINAMHADWLKSEGQFELAMAAEQLAEKGTQDAIDKVLRQEGQVQRMNMQYTY
jgi:hypothetical protein